jgi:cysteine desulfurase / selenocysteine lyase
MVMSTSRSSADRIVYLDNAATSFPKPPGVAAAVAHCLDEVGANPGRGGHRLAVAAGRLVLAARQRVATLVGAHNPMRVVFGANATWGLNVALHGWLREGDRVVTTAMEHNSVLRPLQALAAAGRIRFHVVPVSASGRVDPDDVARALRRGGGASLAVINHASNVNGVVQPLGAIAEACRVAGVPLLVDAAQSLGVVEVDLARDGVALLAFSGHKSLYGPTGTGGLVLGPDLDHRRLRPLVQGGTGSRSSRPLQPDFLPDAFESGTLNVAGLAGLAAGLAWLRDDAGGPRTVWRHEAALRQRFLARAGEAVPGFAAVGVDDGPAVGVVSFRLVGVPASELARRLDEDHGICGRQGLHCAPVAHRALGTFPAGTMRFGFGAFNTRDDVDQAVAALREIGSRP